MPKKYKVAAVIDIGSNELKLQIAQTAKTESSPSAIKYLEDLSYPLGLGRDTFHTGKMSFDKADKACEILQHFRQVAREYDAKNIKTIATTAVREAANMDYILDQIKIKTGLDVEVLDNLDEKRYIHKLLAHYAGKPLKESALMVYISAGSIGVSVFSGGKMPFFNSIRVGSLRMSEMFGDLAAYTHDFYLLMEEYLASFTDLLKRELPPDIKHFIASGQEMGLISGLINGNADAPLFEIPRAEFVDMYNKIKHKTTDQTAVNFNIDGDRADVLLPSMCIYQNLLSLTNAESVTASKLLPCDAIIYEMLYPKAFEAMDKEFHQNALTAAKVLAKRYQSDEAHSKRVGEFALTVFEKMKKDHGLNTRDKLLLQTAVILHDIGKYVSGRSHGAFSYEIVRGSYLPELNKREMEAVALISLYHSRYTPNPRDPRYNALNVEERVRVSKLTAILRVADALDRSHLQKLERISVKLAGGAMTVTAETNANIALEQWAFYEKGSFFEEVFGIKAELKIKRV